MKTWPIFVLENQFLAFSFFLGGIIESTNEEYDEEIEAIRPLVLLRLPTSPELLVKGFDLKPLAKYVHTVHHY